jgi:hypothetical protein
LNRLSRKSNKWTIVGYRKCAVCQVNVEEETLCAPNLKSFDTESACIR